MTKKVSVLINSCRECPFVTNSSKLHDCAFTSAPYPIRWYCTFTKELRMIGGPDDRDRRCPLPEHQ